MDKLSELRKALGVRGVKAKVVRESGLSYRALSLIQEGSNAPLDTTRRLIATALGLPADHFLESKPDDGSPARYRIVAELELPEDFTITEDRLNRIRAAMSDAGTHIINIIKELDTQGLNKGSR